MSDPNKKKIGLLGGSFNPAHEGHVYISKQALALLALDEIWWLVSPQNPLKPREGMAEFTARFEQAKEVTTSEPHIIISDFEKQAGTTYTYDTICALKKKYPAHCFVWLMGADNAIQFPKWHKWQEIANMLPIAIFNRDNCKEQALSGTFATNFITSRCHDTAQLATTPAPAWAFLDIEPNPASATKIRNATKARSPDHRRFYGQRNAGL